MVEACLQIDCGGVDYRDRWRFDPDGCRRLTLRRIYVLLRHVGADSVLGAHERDGKPFWSAELDVLDIIRMALTSTKDKPAPAHPGRPKDRREDHAPEVVADFVARRRRRLARIAAGEIA